VVASDAATADALATAVIAGRAGGLAALAPAGAEALAREAGGRWVMTPGFERWLR
jgi:thiamine biosynthesis lipoprotein ApbE